MKMIKKFWNGKEINEGNLVGIIKECSGNNWKNSDLFRETEIACEIIAFEDYEGRGEDIECILERIDDGATLFDVEKVIQNGQWFFTETETWKTNIKKVDIDPVDLCPDCKVYCTKRFIDGQCE